METKHKRKSVCAATIKQRFVDALANQQTSSWWACCCEDTGTWWMLCEFICDVLGEDDGAEVIAAAQRTIVERIKDESSVANILEHWRQLRNEQRVLRLTSNCEAPAEQERRVCGER